MSIEQIKIQKIINECDKHIKRMNNAYQKISPILPLNVEKYIVLSEDEIGYIDQYLFRFSKLQDTIEKRLFNAFVELKKTIIFHWTRCNLTN